MSAKTNANSGKTVNISYSLNPIRKSLFVPQVTEEFLFGTGLTDPVWQQAAQAEDFVRFHAEENTPFKNTRVALFRTEKDLVIGWSFSDVKEERVYPPENSTSVWSGDLAEVHFGAMGPEPWNLQFCIGITGLLFDSSGLYDWECVPFENETAWGAEIKISLDHLLLSEGGLGFNLCRCSLKHGDSSCWSPLFKRFHEVENFGELLFVDYNTACTLRSGTAPSVPLDRSGFEKLRNSWETPARQVIHGPYLSNPDNGSVSISWETAGRLPAFLEYREKGSSEAPCRVMCSMRNGIMASETAHWVHLTGLKPDTVYEYELFTLLPVLDEPASSGIKRCFRTAPAPEEDFSFFCVTDLHSDANHLVNALSTPEAQSARFHLLLGDNLSHAAGREALYRGIIDPIVSVNQKREEDIPLVFVRGNHEQLGVFANEYFTVMRHPTGRSWYAFSFGKVFFIILDSGDDKADGPDRLLFDNNSMLAEEKRFLEETAASSAYQKAHYRIAFIHIPGIKEEDVQFQLIQPLAEAEIKPDILLSGHWHNYIRIDAGADSCHPATAPALIPRLSVPAPLPFQRAALSTDNVLFCKVTDEKLELEFLRLSPSGEKSVQDRIFLPKRPVLC
ncbi:MAG: metallophosphoesterase family protein [Lentisphaeria bacterium]|nr:metallophosphoesterase family protein [Lentisphaeria bacterium]